MYINLNKACNLCINKYKTTHLYFYEFNYDAYWLESRGRFIVVSNYTQKGLGCLALEICHYMKNKMFSWPNAIFWLKIFGEFYQIFFYPTKHILIAVR